MKAEAVPEEIAAWMASQAASGLASHVDGLCDPIREIRDIRVSSSLPTKNQADRIQACAYTCDNHDRRTSVTRKDALRNEYGYDAIGQLTSAVRKFPGEVGRRCSPSVPRVCYPQVSPRREAIPAHGRV